MVGAVLFVLTLIVVRDHAQAGPLPLPHRRPRPAAAAGHHRRRHGGQRRQAVDPLRGLLHPALGVRQDRHRHLPGRLPERQEGDAQRAHARTCSGVPLPAAKYFGPAGRDVGAVARPAGVHEGLRHVAAVAVRLRGPDVHGHLAAGVRGHWAAPCSPPAPPSPSSSCRHVHERFQVWIDPWPHAATTGYQVLQSLFTIADGGITRRRVSAAATCSSPTTSRSCPTCRPTSSSRPSPTRLGLLGAVGLMLCYLLFCWRGFRIAVWAPDGFSKLLAAGLATAFGAADVHHHRRRHPPDPPDRHHAAVRELRRQLASPPTSCSSRCCSWSRTAPTSCASGTESSACDWPERDEADEQGHRRACSSSASCSSWRSSATSPISGGATPAVAARQAPEPSGGSPRSCASSAARSWPSTAR